MGRIEHPKHSWRSPAGKNHAMELENADSVDEGSEINHNPCHIV
jgi:hypothetical protein